MEFYGVSSGEKAGTIWLREVEPEWKKEFTALPSISARKGIASNFGTPYEDTATLVLTAPSGKFVDIRLPLGFNPDGDTKASILKHDSFWAFCGTVKITFLEPSTSSAAPNAVQIPYAAHAVFQHDLDSKGPGIVDEGDMFLLPNGDTIEIGIWTNPSTGKYEMYKEYWTTPALDSGRSKQDPETGELLDVLNKSPCIVAETTDNERGRGIMIRVGDFAQALYQPNERGLPMVFARYEREYYSNPADGIDSGHSDASEWQIDPRSTGDGNFFPISLVLDDCAHNVGNSASTRNAGPWQIREAWLRKQLT